MRKHITYILILFFTFALVSPISASSCETTQSGFFGSNIWNCSTGETYQTADTLIIKHDVEMKSNTTYNIQADVVIIEMSHTMEFLANAQLNMTTAGSHIVLESNAEIFTNNNASQTLIQINNTPVWGGSNCSACNNDPITGPDVITENSSPGNSNLLPIELSSFNLEKSSQGVRITWSTSQEVNNDFFTVYRSRDAERWESIATVTGAGNSYSTQHYQIEDTEVKGGTFYYKLKQTDFDGKFEYFDVANIKLSDESINIYPNPASEFIQIRSEVENLTVRISNLSGVMVLNKLVSGHGKVNVSNLSSGVYYLTIRGERTSITEKLVIQ